MTLEIAYAALDKGPECKRSNGAVTRVNPDGKTAFSCGPCHACMNGKDAAFIALHPNWRTQTFRKSLVTLTEEKALRFYDWFVNRSWAAPFIITRDAAYASTKGIILDAPVVPANYALAIATMTRNCGEHAAQVAKMLSYVDEFGVSEDLAYALAFTVCDAKNQYGVAGDYIAFGHNLFSPAANVDHWRAFVRRDIQTTSLSLASDGLKEAVNVMWGRDYCRPLKDQIKAYTKAKATGGVVIVNPFLPQPKYGEASVTEAQLRDAIPALKEELDDNA